MYLEWQEQRNEEFRAYKEGREAGWWQAGVF
jgi:hypothetical protein